MNRSILTLLGALGLVLSLAAQTPARYSAVEIDPFVAAPQVHFPREYQSALLDDIAREVSVEFPTLMILRQGDRAPGQPALRISGTITDFKPGSKTKRALIGFGAGAAVLRATVIFQDAAGGRTLQERDLTGSTGLTGIDSQGAAQSLAKRIAKVSKAAGWFSK